MSSNSTCLFCRIAGGSIPSHSVHESPRIVAFLDIQPIRPGHVLIVPREHYPYFDALPSEVAHEILHVGQRLAPVLREQWKVERVAFMFTGTDVVHAHAHVLPMVEPTDVTSRRYIAEERLTFRTTPRVPDPELAATAALLKEALVSSRGHA
jgi:histidine triad (HIT) family protein